MFIDYAPPMACWAWSNLLNQYMLLFLAPAVRNASCSAAGFALAGCNATFSSSAMTGFADYRPSKANLFLTPTGYPFERNVQIHLDIRPTQRPFATMPKKTVKWTLNTKIKIEPAKNICKIDTVEQVFPAEIRHACEPARIILGPLLGVGQYRISLGNFLEAFLGTRFLIAVRMVFQGEVAEGILDHLLVGVPGNA